MKPANPKIILSIETSCDETALAVLSCSQTANEKLSCTVFGQAINSQIELHKQYGGVFPMMAKREHGKNIAPLFLHLLNETTQHIKSSDEIPGANYSLDLQSQLNELGAKDPDLLKNFYEFIFNAQIPNPGINEIAVTTGPGLEPALWVGITFAKLLGLVWNIPVIASNHMRGHIASVLFDQEETFSSYPIHTTRDIQFPAIALLISGNHTELISMESFAGTKLMGKTKDDAIGEAFDKVARMLDLPYPGGPEISKLATLARTENIVSQYVFPRPMIHSKDFDFSFSGLKTAVLYTIQKIQASGVAIDEHIKKQIALEFENAVTEVLISKTKKALEEINAHTLAIGGGVIANTHIRFAFEALAQEMGITLLIPPFKLCGDNAVMTGLASYIWNDTENTLKADGNKMVS